MIRFNQLSIDPSSQHLIIDALVDESYSGVEIDSITIVVDSQDTYTPGGPSENPICVQKHIQEGQMTSNINLLISEEELGVYLDNTMLFVYIIAKCNGQDISKNMGAVVNLYPYYQGMMNGVKEINNTCNVPKYFINNILRLKAVELSIRTGNYIQAIKYWKKFFSTERIKTEHRPCGCRCYERDN